MHIAGNAPTLEHAELNSAYLPRPEDPHMSEARRIAAEIERTGSRGNDLRVDALVEHALAIANRYEYAPEPREWSCAQRVMWRYSRIPYEQRYQIVEDRTVSEHVKAFAYVNAGRWSVACPFPRCGGHQYASFHDRRFFCVEEGCDNKAVNYKWIEVVWPQDHLAIEALLGARPLSAKNWNPGETAEDIARQDKDALGIR